MDYQGLELVYWMHNYIAEQAGRQFIGSGAVANEFGVDAVAAGEKSCTGAKISGFHRVGLTDDHRACITRATMTW